MPPAAEGERVGPVQVSLGFGDRLAVSPSPRREGSGRIPTTERTNARAALGEDVPVSVLTVDVLGPPLVRWGEQAVRFRTRKEIALLVYLALTGKAQPRERLAALFWPDRDADAGRALLRQTLTLLRRHLADAGRGPEGASGEALTALTAGRNTLGSEVVGLARDAFPLIALDVERLAAAAAAGVLSGPRSVASEHTAAELAAAAAAYRGPFLEGMAFDDAPELELWVEEQRAYWQQQAETVLARLARAQLAHRAPEEALATARRWLALNPVSEPAYQVVMRALAELRDRAGALAAYAEGRATLRAKLGVDPSPETVALAERLRRAPTQTPPDGDAAAAEAGARPTELPFVGRRAEFARLVEAYRAARRGRLQVVVVEGEAGIGKTSLAEEFLSWATLEGTDVLRGQGYPGQGRTPYQPLVDALRPRLARESAPDDLLADVWLAELVRLFPELRERYPDLPLPATLPPADTTGQGRLYEAVAQLLLALGARAGSAGLVLFCDDAQWVDQATRDFLRYWAKRQQQGGGSHVLLVTLRAGALEADPELGTWLEALERQAPVTRLPLGPLTPDETTEVVRAWLRRAGSADGERVDQLTARLYAQTEGQTFYLVETLGALDPQGVARPGPDSSGLTPTLEVPGRVRDVIRGQLAGLSSAARDLAGALAVLGSDVTFERLRRVAELDEDVGLGALDELGRRRLVVEHADDRGTGRGLVPGPPSLRFSHELVREVVYTELGETRRLILHRRALTVLEGEGLPAVELAHHALNAGLPEPAFHQSVTAGDAALAVCAPRDAISHFERAQGLLAELEARQVPVGADAWAHLHGQLARAYEWVGAWERARTTFDALLRHARAVGDATLEGIALTRLALLTWWDARDLVGARALAAEAVRAAESTGDGEVLAQAHWVAGHLAFIAGDPDTARAHARQAEELGRALGHRELIAGSLFLQGRNAVRAGDWDDGIAALRLSRAVYAELTEGVAVASPAAAPAATRPLTAYFPWMGRGVGTEYVVGAANCAAWEGLAAICRGEPRRGVELGREALRLRPNRPDEDWLEAYGAWALTTGLVEAGAYEEALRTGRRALQRALGVSPLDLQVRPLAFWARAQQALLDLEEAGRAVAEAVDRAEKLGIGGFLVVPLSLRCANLVLAGDWAGAYDAARQVVSAREPLRERLLPFDFARDYEIAALVQSGDRALATTEVRRLGERLRDDGSDRRYWLVYRRMQAALARGERDNDATRLRLAEALELAAAIGLPGQEWEIAAELAGAWREAGDGAATAALDRSLATIDALAEPIGEERVRESFRSAARQRARALAGITSAR